MLAIRADVRKPTAVTVTLWPCSTVDDLGRQCGLPGVRNIAASGFCAEHLAAFYFRVLGGLGVGRQVGPLRLDWGPNFANLECCVCEATWVGPLGEPCYWCERLDQIQRKHQAEIVSRPPDIDRADTRFVPAMRAWGERLARAVAAGIVTEDRARNAWRRQVGP